MIKQAKDVLAQVVQERVPDAVIVRSVSEEQHAIMARKYPVVALITNPGRFDDREAKTVRYQDEEQGIWVQRKVRGNRIIPILLRCWAEGEDAADEAFSRIIPAIPRRWEYDDFEGHVLINAEEHSDNTGNVAKLYLSVAEVQFAVDVATEVEIVPTVKTIDVVVDGMANQP